MHTEALSNLVVFVHTIEVTGNNRCRIGLSKQAATRRDELDGRAVFPKPIMAAWVFVISRDAGVLLSTGEKRLSGPERPVR